MLRAVRLWTRRIIKSVFVCGIVYLAGGAVIVLLPPTVPPAGHLMAFAAGGTYLGSDGVRYQRSDVDCGVAALEMVFIGLGLDYRVLEPLRAMVVSRDSGLTMLEMHDVATSHGLAAEGQHMNLAALSQVPLPVVASFPRHWIVVDRVTPDGYVDIRDPEIGRMRMTRTQFLARWTGHVLLVRNAA